MTDDSQKKPATYEELSRELQGSYFQDILIFGNCYAEEEIEDTERALGIKLPPALRGFVKEYGTLFKVAPPRIGDPDGIASLTGRLRDTEPSLPPGLIVFSAKDDYFPDPAWTDSGLKYISARKYSCLDFNRVVEGEPRLTYWTPEAPDEAQRLQYREKISEDNLWSFDAFVPHRVEEADISFIDWLDDAMDRYRYGTASPANWRDNAAWERYWERRIKEKQAELTEETPKSAPLPLSPLFSPGFAPTAFHRGAEEPKRILFVGNGINTEPLQYVYAGFHVTVLDCSSVACEQFRAAAAATDDAVRTFLLEESKNSSLLKPAEPSEPWGWGNRKFIYIPGGYLEIICADMFEWTPENPYDFIHNKLALLGFTREDQTKLIHTYFDWLNPGGHLQISYLTGTADQDELTEELRQAGFLVRGGDFDAAFRASRNGDKRLARKLFLQLDEHDSLVDALTLHKGAKLAWIMFGSVL